MRNNGPDQWRQWQFGNIVVPLYMPDPKVKLPEGQKPIAEAAALTVRAFMAKGEKDKFEDEIKKMLEAPDSPSGRFPEGRFREVLYTAAAANLSKEETEEIFPVLSKEGSRKPSKGNDKKGSKRRCSSKQPEAPPADAS